MEKFHIKLSFDLFRYISSASTVPLIIYGPIGSGKSVLSAQIEQNIHDWLPNCCFILRYAHLTPISSNLASLIGSIVEQLHYYVRAEPYKGLYVSNKARNSVDNSHPLISY